MNRQLLEGNKKSLFSVFEVFRELFLWMSPVIA